MPLNFCRFCIRRKIGVEKCESNVMISFNDSGMISVLIVVTESKRMVSGFLGKELLRKELRVRISCSPL